MEKQKTIDFNKWLFDKKLVPNSSFLWFDYTESRDSVRFFELEDLFDVFIEGKSLKEFKKDKEGKSQSFFTEYGA